MHTCILVLAKVNLTNLYKKLNAPCISRETNDKFSVSEFSDFSKREAYQAAIERGLELTCREMDNMGVEEHARKITGIMKDTCAHSNFEILFSMLDCCLLCM
eukprot:scpid101410/ scgid4283/ 